MLNLQNVGEDVAVKVFLDQDLKVEALDEFRREVC
jgi:hypothetical protein